MAIIGIITWSHGYQLEHDSRDELIKQIQEISEIGQESRVNK